MLREMTQLTPKNFEDLLNALSDGIYISDGEGNTLWVNKSSENIIGKPKSELIGRNVRQLEAEGAYNPSITRMVLEAGKTISTVQVMKNGRKYLVTGHLIRNEQEKIELILAHSRDITEAVRTTSQLEETEALLRRYGQEIRNIKLKQNDHLEHRPVIGKSRTFLALQDLIDKVAAVSTTVLITGETGVGKNVIAKRIHQLSERYEKPFVHINCSAIPESLIESELFGYTKGAFTGANSSGKIGLVKMADQGTLFLDEIGELPLHVQSKLLQLIQDKTFMPVGDTRVHMADVRIIAATNQDLAAMSREGRFRSDLYFRLNILPIHVPPLKERREDIFPLLFFYLKKFNREHRQNRKFSPEVLDLLQQYDWPGNIRELENLVERLVITANKTEISMSDLPENVRAQNDRENASINMLVGETLTEMMERIEMKIIEKAYMQHKSTRKTAQALGVTQSLLMRRIKKYGLNFINQE
ncbi:sigma-54 interaction domain-containing protein [Effusibacillus lacus]|uniref:HTH-type transcriptional regulatory protein TyrR n=1 Tax=Effusibacillus lacus TaxID=1348429 RepID=A0A292YR42_9BACL|nr:sigma 54-interacting transcriptional regulator [Effusibacillus lacus]TCS72567.1 PAS domain S-box-containing protein/TyrR family helix-turn-helix protein [Effusibacillus lacus]GAX90874.1 transcriptional regulator [Effusibacillus lacus]